MLSLIAGQFRFGTAWLPWAPGARQQTPALGVPILRSQPIAAGEKSLIATGSEPRSEK
jgi:hypothetical protein